MRNLWVFCCGALIGTLGGLVGLGGAEFRLPLLVGIFKYRTLQAIIINLIVSLVTVVFALIFRTGLSGLDSITAHAPIILNILAGSLIGSYAGVHFATRINERTLNRIVVVLLVCVGLVLIGHDFIFHSSSFVPGPLVRTILGFLAGVIIGIFSSMLGVAGGELIIPTIILLFAVDIKLAGTLSLAISIPTIVVGLLKYRSRPGFTQLKPQTAFIALMSLGSIGGALLGSYLLRYAPSPILQVMLGLLLLVSAIKLSISKATPKTLTNS